MAVGKIIGRAIATDAIGADQIAPGAITVADIPDGEITDVKLHTTLDFSSKTFTMADAHVTQTMVTQHQAALSLTQSQISDLSTTTDLTEGTNLYYTDARVDARLASGSVGNIVTTGYLAGPASFTIDPAGIGDNTGTVIIAGNLQVDGTTTTINSTTVTVDDLNLTLASGAADANAANGAGITIDGANAAITYDASNDEIDFNKDINVNNTVRVNGAGVGNLYIAHDGINGALANTTGNLLFYANGNQKLIAHTNGQQRFAIDGDGITGVGTSSPATYAPTNSKLTVYDAGNQAGITLATASTSGVNTIYFADGTTGTDKYRGIVEYQHANDQLNLYASATRIATLTTEGITVNSGNFRTDQIRHSVNPTLNLDFANSKQLDPGITFTRNGRATYYDENGTIKYANHNEPRFDHNPTTGESLGLLVEPTRTNTTPYSQHIIAGYGWGVSGSGTYVQPNAGVSPDGKYNATRIVFAAASHAVSINNSGAWTAGDTVTTSMWIKGTVGETMRFASGGADFGNITLTGEWQRVEGTRTTVNTYTNINTYGGATARDVLVWGVQAEVASFATSYIPSSTRFVSRSTVATYHDETGVIRTAFNNSPRYGYKYDGRNWIETGLILEQGSTNRKQNFLNLGTGVRYWSNNQRSEPVHNTSITAPDGSYSVIKQEINDIANAIHSIYKNSAVTAGTQLCFSVYAKAAEYDRIYLYADGVVPTIGGIFYDLANGTVIGTPLQTYEAYGIENVGNGWYRCWFTGTPTSQTQAYVHIDIAQSDNNRTFVGTPGEGVYLWGPQLEYSIIPSSYIYTIDQAVSRNADVAASGPNTRSEDYVALENIDQSTWFNPDQGTVFVESTPRDHTPPSATYYFVNVDDGSPLNTMTLRYGDIIGGTDLFAKSFNTVEVDLASFASSAGTEIKSAISYAQNDVAYTVNAGTVLTDGSYTINNRLDRLQLAGTLTGYSVDSKTIKKVSYYPSRLSNAEIAALTENN